MLKNFLKLEKVLSSEQKMIIDSTKAFANQYLKPRIINDYKNEVVDKSIFKEMGQMGILGPTIKGYNCLGDSYLTYGLIAKEIEAIDSGYRSMFSVQSSLVMNPINKFGSIEDIFEICKMLSENKSKFITGSLFKLDGSQTKTL